MINVDVQVPLWNLRLGIGILESKIQNSECCVRISGDADVWPGVNIAAVDVQREKEKPSHTGVGFFDMQK